MENQCAKDIQEAMELAERMIQLADQGAARCKDDCCLMVQNVIRDCAYKIRQTIVRNTDAILKR